MTQVPNPNYNWLLNVEDAIKQKLSGYTVTNPADGKQIPVGVWFRYPDTEERIRTFPHIAIDLIDIVFDRTRAARAGLYPVPYDMEQATPPAGYSLVGGDMPLPWMIQYQLSALSRQPRHDRQLTQMLYQLFPEMFGWLDMSSIDGTIRRADLLSVVRRDMLDTERKRVYRAIFTVAISAEFSVYQMQYVQQATGFEITFDVFVNQAASASGTPNLVEIYNG